MMNKEVINPWKKPYIRFISELILSVLQKKHQRLHERKADKTRIVTAPKGRRGILSYIDFIEDVTSKKPSATVDDLDASIGTVVGPSETYQQTDFSYGI